MPTLATNLPNIFATGVPLPTKSPEALLNELGGKGYNLFLMDSAHLPVPTALVIGTSYCVDYMKGSLKGADLETTLKLMVMDATTLHDFDKDLVSVRSGARVSMAGMMDTILNVGITADNVKKYEKLLGERTAWDCFRRLIQMYGEIVKGIEKEHFDIALDGIKKDFSVESDSDLETNHLKELCAVYENIYVKASGEPFPNTVEEQLTGAIVAVWKSWNNERAIYYRELNNIPHDWGTAVVIQKMVFGNKDANSCTGVLFTRSPSDGSPYVTGEFLINAQGEDVVAGTSTPMPLSVMKQMNPTLYTQLTSYAKKMELYKADMQDMEFTVESGKLYFLQTRNGKRTSAAAVRIAVDLVNDAIIGVEHLKNVVSYEQFCGANRPSIKESDSLPSPDGSGLAASNGVAFGLAAFTVAKALELHTANKPVILVTKETTPDDIKGMAVSKGILTSTGGATCHAAVVARGMDKVCVVGLTALTVGHTKAVLNGVEIIEGVTLVTICGSTGRVWVGKNIPVHAGNSQYVLDLLQLAKKAANTHYCITTVAEALSGFCNPSIDYVHLTGQESYEQRAKLQLMKCTKYLVWDTSKLPQMLQTKGMMGGTTFLDSLIDTNHIREEARAIMVAVGTYYVVHHPDIYVDVLSKVVKHAGITVFDLSLERLNEQLECGNVGLPILGCAAAKPLEDVASALVGYAKAKRPVIGVKALVYKVLT